jgi:hypothetical protein
VACPVYLLTTDYMTSAIAFSIQGAFTGATHGVNPSYANKRFPTEIGATAAAFCYHIGAVSGEFVPPVLTWFAVQRHMGFAVPMLIGTVGGLISLAVTLFFDPETKRARNGPGDRAAGGNTVAVAVDIGAIAVERGRKLPRAGDATA